VHFKEPRADHQASGILIECRQMPFMSTSTTSQHYLIKLISSTYFHHHLLCIYSSLTAYIFVPQKTMDKGDIIFKEDTRPLRQWVTFLCNR